MAHAALAPQLQQAPSSVVIVGGGFAGAALAYHLLHRPSPLHVTLVERSARVGRGLAYAAENPVLRLNVPAAHMSLDPERPDDFVQFAGCEATPEEFMPRRQYGAYIEARLAQAAREQPNRLRLLRGEVVAIEPDQVLLADGRSLRADRIAIATGLAANSGNSSWPDDPRVADAWNEAGCTHAAAQGGRILLVGAGLSAVDTLQLLASAGHDDPVVVISRHGLLPRPHAAYSGDFEIPSRLGPAPSQLRQQVRWVRAVVREAESTGGAWQHAIDALRPHLPQLWQQLSTRDRVRFVRQLRTYWEVLRHRAPRDALAAIEARRARGKLQVWSARVLECHAREQGLDVSLRMHGGERRVERFDHVVRCLGPALALEQSAPLLAALVRAGHAQRDPAGLGIVTGEHGRLSDGSGRPSDKLFALGQPCRASRWETTSVPDIVLDAVALAELFTKQALASASSVASLAGSAR